MAGGGGVLHRAGVGAVDADTMGRSKYDPTRAEIERAGRMQQKAALQMAILLSSGLLLAACGGSRGRLLIWERERKI